MAAGVANDSGSVPQESRRSAALGPRAGASSLHQHQRIECCGALPVWMDNHRIEFDLPDGGLGTQYLAKPLEQHRYAVHIRRRSAAKTAQQRAAFEPIQFAHDAGDIEVGR